MKKLWVGNSLWGEEGANIRCGAVALLISCKNLVEPRLFIGPVRTGSDSKFIE